MEFDEAVRRRRMTRSFDGEPLEATTVNDLLAAALRAPSAGNTQGRDLVVLEGPTETSTYWESTTDEEWRKRSRRYQGMARAPVVVLVFSDPEAYVSRYRQPDKARSDGDTEWVVPFWHVDAAYATMSLLLAAADRGIGAAFLGNFRGEATLKAALGVPDRMAWLGAVLLGQGDGQDPPSASLLRTKRTVEESVHRGTW